MVPAHHDATVADLAASGTHAGLPPARWTNRSGERADWRWLNWDDPPHTN